MSNTISLTIPMTRNALAAAAKMLKDLAIADKPTVSEEFGPVEAPTPPAPIQELAAPQLAPPTAVKGPFEAAAAAELDSDGLPWDARIHASSRTRLKKTGQWKPKRGADAALVAQVTAELQGDATAPPPAVDESVITPTPPPAVELVAETQVKDFTGLVVAVMGAGIPADDQNAACREFGVPEMRFAANFPDLIPKIAARLGV